MIVIMANNVYKQEITQIIPYKLDLLFPKT